MKPIVLVENEITAGGVYDHWQDVTGERYQYPNQYKNKVQPGREFVYYRGVRRANGTRGNAEYFGTGIIGSVGLDPTTDQSKPKALWKWICDVEEYRPFPKPVPAKESGVFFEDIPKNIWSVGVREISSAVFSRILERAGFESQTVDQERFLLPPMSAVVPQLSGSVIRPNTSESRTLDCPGLEAGGRRSRYSRALGRRGEEIVLAHLRSSLPSAQSVTIRWVADEGETPGWDIEYRSDGEIVGVEVKATGGPCFPSLEMTANEWRAAEEMGKRYRLVLVANARSGSPLIQFIDDPLSMLAQDKAIITPVVWRMVFR